MPNEVINLANHRVMRQVTARSSNIMFPVEQHPLKDLLRTGSPIQDPFNMTAVIRTDTHEILGVHGKKYKVISNQEVFGRFEEVLARGALDLTGLRVEDRISYKGAWCQRDYWFPAHRVETRPGDTSELRLRAFNSYDGSTPFGLMVGAYRLICSNGMVVGNSLMRRRMRHTSGFKLEGILGMLTQALTLFTENATQWQTWVNTPVTDAEADAVFDAVPGVNESLKERLQGHWITHKEDMGANKWALFNAMTYWSSHDKINKSSEGNAAAVINQRESRIERVLQDKSFLRLAA